MPAYQQHIIDFLSLSDYVKFAKHVPTKPDADNAVDLIKRFVQETKVNKYNVTDTPAHNRI